MIMLDDSVTLWLSDKHSVRVSSELYEKAFINLDDFDYPFYSLVDGYLSLKDWPEKTRQFTLNDIGNPPIGLFEHVTIDKDNWYILYTMNESYT